MALYRHVESGEVRDLQEDHSATLGWVAAGVWEPVEETKVEADVAETPEKPARRKAVDKKETR